MLKCTAVSIKHVVSERLELQPTSSQQWWEPCGDNTEAFKHRFYLNKYGIVPESVWGTMKKKKKCAYCSSVIVLNFNGYFRLIQKFEAQPQCHYGSSWSDMVCKHQPLPDSATANSLENITVHLEKRLLVRPQHEQPSTWQMRVKCGPGGQLCSFPRLFNKIR